MMKHQHSVIITVICLVVATLALSTNVRADFPFADEVSEELRDNSCYMQSYWVMKWLKSKQGKDLIDTSYVLANRKAKEWAQDAKLAKFCFREPAEGGNKLEYLFTSESESGRYSYFLETGAGIPSPGHYGDAVKKRLTKDCIPIDTSKWKVSLTEMWTKMLDAFEQKGIWKSEFSQLSGFGVYAVLEMMNTGALVWTTELFAGSVQSGPVWAGFTMDATTGAIISDDLITPELLLHRAEKSFGKNDYYGALETYRELKSHFGQYKGRYLADELLEKVRERMVACMERFEGKLPRVRGKHVLPTDTSVTMISFFSIMDDWWSDSVYYETEDRELYRINCKMYYVLGYREKSRGKLPEYSRTALRQRGIKKFDFATQVVVGSDGKIDTGKRPSFLAGTGYPDWDYEIVNLVRDTWRWEPLPIETSGIIYFQFRPHGEY